MNPEHPAGQRRAVDHQMQPAQAGRLVENGLEDVRVVRTAAGIDVTV